LLQKICHAAPRQIFLIITSKSIFTSYNEA
jgi:hypothetical protein